MRSSRWLAILLNLVSMPPVPAGMSRPTMTFSLRPSSTSVLPRTAASVSTRVVSWKEAAEMKERVCRLALVMPSSTGCPVAGLRLDRGVGVLEVDPVHLLPLEEVGRAWIVHLGLLQHLPDDHLDMLVVDGDALQPVDLLDLVDEVVGQLLDALDRQDVVRCRVTIEQELALLDAIALLHGEMPSLGDQILDRLAAVLVRHDGDAPLVLVVAAKLHRA